MDDNRLIIVSGDSHAGVPKDLWTEYLPKQYHEMLPQLRKDCEIYPMSIYLMGVKREGERFDEHVVADAVHENIAAVDLAGGLVRQEPELAGAVLWGARALALLDARWAEQVLGAWEDGRSSLLEPAGSPETGELVGPVAEGPDPRLAATA